MDDNKIFAYCYSAQESKEAREIREKYVAKKESKIDELRRLDRKVQSAGMIEGLCIGIIGLLIFGLGMCVGLEALGGGMTLAVILGVIGAVIMPFAYPVYRVRFNSVKRRYVGRILELTEELGAKEK